MEKIKNYFSWLDRLEGSQYQLKVWRSVALLAMILAGTLGVSTLLLAIKAINDFKAERLVLVPALQRKLEIPAQSYISNSYVEAVSRRIVELQEQWSYNSIQDNYDELFKTYYSNKLVELTKANLISTDRFSYVRENRIVSTFDMDDKKSEFLWCEKIKRACALIVGKRSIFINNNEPYSEKEVAYLILGQSVWPDENNPFALKVSRVKVDDSSVDPYMNMKKQLEAAKNGVVENEN